MKCYINPKRIVGNIDQKIYGHFIEHFHRQIYGGVYDPTSLFADKDGLRSDVLSAMKNIKVPILRWPGGCFVSSYNWKRAVGPARTPFFDKAWRVEDPNSFGTDEYIKLCRKINCEPYICTNAGTGTAEEMSDWVEYCNLNTEGEFAKWRISNGYTVPHNVKYWSIGNENYGSWEIGAKDAAEWSRLVLEAAKMMRHVDPTVQLSAAALTDSNWNVALLRKAGAWLDWISIHSYEDPLQSAFVYSPSDYETLVGRSENVSQSISKVKGALMMLGLDKKIKIAYDEWNPRGWHHPYIHNNLGKGLENDEYLRARDLNDTNKTYTMADAVFCACFLNECIRNCDVVKMANFAPVVNTTGAIFTHKDGIVKRSTYYVFELMTHYMGDESIDLWMDTQYKERVGENVINMVDIVAAKRTSDSALTLSAVNKYDESPLELEIPLPENYTTAKMYTLNGTSKDSFNDICDEQIYICKNELVIKSDCIKLVLPPHSVNIIEIL